VVSMTAGQVSVARPPAWGWSFAALAVRRGWITLLVERGADFPLPRLRRVVAADCARMVGGRMQDPCGVRFPELSAVFRRGQTIDKPVTFLTGNGPGARWRPAEHGGGTSRCHSGRSRALWARGLRRPYRRRALHLAEAADLGRCIFEHSK
jgi:hypothetical protein